MYSCYKKPVGSCQSSYESQSYIEQETSDNYNDYQEQCSSIGKTINRKIEEQGLQNLFHKGKDNNKVFKRINNVFVQRTKLSEIENKMKCKKQEFHSHLMMSGRRHSYEVQEHMKQKSLNYQIKTVEWKKQLRGSNNNNQ